MPFQSKRMVGLQSDAFSLDLPSLKRQCVEDLFGAGDDIPDNTIVSVAEGLVRRDERSLNSLNDLTWTHGGSSSSRSRPHSSLDDSFCEAQPKRLRSYHDMCWTEKNLESPRAATGAKDDAELMLLVERIFSIMQQRALKQDALAQSVDLLNNFQKDVRAAALQEADEEHERAQEGRDDEAHNHVGSVLSQADVTKIKQENSVLRQAIVQLARRFRRLEAAQGQNHNEVDSLRMALEESQESHKRLERANAVLWSQVQINLDGCRSEYRRQPCA